MKVKFITFIIGAAAFAFITACEGPEGPMGPAGPAGAAGATGPVGADGSDGTPGVAGSAECLACHSSDNKYRVTIEYEGSGHASGSTAARGSSGSCAPCHSKEGFVEVMWTGKDRAAGFAFPTRIGCTTCHGWHNESFDTATGPDYALRTNGAVDLLMYRAASLPAQEIDLGDNGNLCVQCHQPRTSWDALLASDNNLGDGTYDQDNEHFGAHHGVHATTLMGIGGADGTSELSSGPDTHGNLATCVTCHMNEQDHSFEPSLNACNVAGCHSTSPKTSLDENPEQLEIAAKIEELEDALLAAGLLYYEKDTIWSAASSSSNIAEIDSALALKTGIFPIGQVGALYNYGWIMDDKSDGLHNFEFVDGLLDKSLEALP